MLVRVIKNWDWPDLMRQSPEGKGRWGEVQFTLDPVEACDYVIVINRVPEASVVRCVPEHVWALSQEPPVPEYEWFRLGYPFMARVFTPEIRFQGAKYLHTHGALPWHVNKSYDELRAMSIPKKTKSLSWITSDKKGREGHKARLSFMKRVESKVQFDLWGRGFRALEDKWDGLAPYRYSLAIENHSGPYYWTEKITDCFLSWTMPIYYGCTNIGDYFPPESFVAIDIHEPNVAEHLRDIVAGDSWQKNREAVNYARQLVLEKHQFFPFISDRVQADSSSPGPSPVQQIRLPELPNMYPVTLKGRLKKLVAKWIGSIKSG